MKDEEIIGLYLERNQTAISETESKYGSYLSKVAYNILRSYDDTEEIVNDTYMGAWKAIPPTIPDSLKYFLVKITRNLAMDRVDYNMAAKRRAIFVELDETLPDKAGSPETAWEAREIGKVLNEFLETLEEDTCGIFVSRYFYCLSIKEIAKKYGITERQVKYQLAKTRDKLQQKLQKEGVLA